MYSSDNYFQSSDGRKLFYRTHQPESVIPQHTVLCLPGVTRNHRDYNQLPQLVGGDTLFICPDMRGRCYSEYDSEPQNYQLQRYVQDMWELLNYEQIDDVILIGTSLGGLMSMVMASEQPARIRKVVINDIGNAVEEAPINRILGYMRETQPKDNWQQAIDAVKAINGDFFTDLNDTDWQAFARRLYHEQPDGSITLAYDPAIAHQLPAQAIDMRMIFEALVATPMLLVRGALSDLLSPATVNDMQKIKPDMQFLEVANRGHAPFLTEPESVDALQRFIYS